MFCIMRFFLLYLATISTAIAGPYIDLWSPSSPLDSSASQGSVVGTSEIGLLDTNSLFSAKSSSVEGVQLPNTDLLAPGPGAANLQQGDQAQIKLPSVLQPLYRGPLDMIIQLLIPTCEDELPGSEPYCCDEHVDAKKIARGCGHCRPLSILLCA